ncbi:MAG TPA: cupin domain-containing protein [Thermoleophilaceae bacterium]|nr:cupin domain-containing protein [Thermoleophilaceae bacterium]
MAPIRLSASEVRAAFPAGTVLRNPVTGEYTRIIEHTAEQGVGEMLAVPGGAVAGPHRHPGQDERFEVLEGVMGYRRGEERGELRPGESVTVSASVMHDWWNAGDENLRARVTVTPPGSFAAMIGAVGGLVVLGRTNAKGMPGILDAALLAEAFDAPVWLPAAETPDTVTKPCSAPTARPRATVQRNKATTRTSIYRRRPRGDSEEGG